MSVLNGARWLLQVPLCPVWVPYWLEGVVMTTTKNTRKSVENFYNTEGPRRLAPVQSSDKNCSLSKRFFLELIIKKQRRHPRYILYIFLYIYI